MFIFDGTVAAAAVFFFASSFFKNIIRTMFNMTRDISLVVEGTSSMSNQK